jgi:hypothetical protein
MPIAIATPVAIAGWGMVGTVCAADDCVLGLAAAAITVAVAIAEAIAVAVGGKLVTAVVVPVAVPVAVAIAGELVQHVRQGHFLLQIICTEGNHLNCIPAVAPHSAAGPAGMPACSWPVGERAQSFTPGPQHAALAAKELHAVVRLQYMQRLLCL